MPETSASWGLRAPDLRHAKVRRVLQAAAALQPRALPPSERARLVVEGPGGSVDMHGRSQVLLGRAAACDLVVPGGGVSRVHAAVVRRGGEYWIEDLGSANGTWHRGERVQRRRIAGGEEVHLCGTAVRFHLW
jgi:pSer/pThr/pTyr-binding forkhead associated (FHA) protein